MPLLAWIPELCARYRDIEVAQVPDVDGCGDVCVTLMGSLLGFVAKKYTRGAKAHGVEKPPLITSG